MENNNDNLIIGKWIIETYTPNHRGWHVNPFNAIWIFQNNGELLVRDSRDKLIKMGYSFNNKILIVKNKNNELIKFDVSFDNLENLIIENNMDKISLKKIELNEK